MHILLILCAWFLSLLPSSTACLQVTWHVQVRCSNAADQGCGPQGCGRSHSWADCVSHVKGKDSLYDRLRSNFKSLGRMAEEYATASAGGGFRAAAATLDRVTKKVRISGGS